MGIIMSVELLNIIEEVTGVDYSAQKGDYSVVFPLESVVGCMKDLLNKYGALKQEFEAFKENIEVNYKSKTYNEFMEEIV